jgi:hypothetical protein
MASSFSSFLQFCIDQLSDEERDDGRKRKCPRKHREELEREDFQNAPWQRMIDSGSYKSPRTRHGLHFRRRYRVPASVFDFIVEKAVCGRWFQEYGAGTSAVDALGRPIPSLHVKILSSLRILATGCAYSDCYDGSFMDGQTVRKFYYRFLHQFVLHFYSEWIYGPRDDAELTTTLSIYHRLGLTGAIGSTDCFHLFWDRCPQQLKVDCKNGKYKRCTLVFSIVNDHHRRIYSCTHPFHGTCNDKVVASYDGFICNLKNERNPLYSNRAFVLRNELGVAFEVQGVWLLCDGGYHKWRIMQSPPNLACSGKEVLFREVLESARKSTECLIGILKARFWAMKHPIRLTSKSTIANMVWACCILHNMLLKFDGLSDLWTEDDWLSHPPDICDTDAEIDEEVEGQPGAYRKVLKRFHPEKLARSVSKINMFCAVYALSRYELVDDALGAPTGPVEVEVGHSVLRGQLVDNLDYLWNKHEVEHLTFPSQRPR